MRRQIEDYSMPPRVRLSSCIQRGEALHASMYIVFVLDVVPHQAVVAERLISQCLSEEFAGSCQLLHEASAFLGGTANERVAW